MSFTTEPITKLPIIVKDPQNDLDYTVSFVDFLAETGDTIGNIEVTSESGNCTIHDPVTSAGKVTARISGGTLGRFEPIKYKIQTAIAPIKTAETTILVHIKQE